MLEHINIMDNSEVKTFEIVWQDYVPYGAIQIDDMVEFISTNMEGLLPLYAREKKRIVGYADQNMIDIRVLLSIRSQIRTQKEYEGAHKVSSKTDYILDKFSNFVSIVDDKDSDKSWKQVINFYASMKIPPHSIMDVIRDSEKYSGLGNQIKDLLSRPLIDQDDLEKDSAKRAKGFEDNFENWLKTTGIKFKTEVDIRNEGLHKLTPDFLLEVPIIIKFNNIKYPIHWLDVKNYFLIDSQLIVRGLKKQSQKYNEAFGPGAFIFRFGADPRVLISDTVVLNGEFIELIN